MEEEYKKCCEHRVHSIFLRNDSVPLEGDGIVAFLQ